MYQTKKKNPAISTKIILKMYNYIKIGIIFPKAKFLDKEREREKKYIYTHIPI